MAASHPPEYKRYEFSGEVDLTDLSDEKLKIVVTELRMCKCILNAENKILEKCFENFSSETSQTSTAKQSISSTRDIDGNVESEFERSRRRSTRASISTGTGVSSDIFKSLTWEQKCEMAKLGIKLVRQELEKFIREKERHISQLDMQLQDLSSKEEDVKEEMKLFCKVVVDEGVNDITGLIKSEKVTQFFNKNFRILDLKQERCRLNIETYKNIIKELDKKLSDDYIPPIPYEFEALKIENEELEELLRQKSVEVSKRKRDLLASSVNLGLCKVKLNKLTTENSTIKMNVDRSRRTLEKINKQSDSIKNEIIENEIKLRKLQNQVDEPDEIALNMYITLNAELNRLEKLVMSTTRNKTQRPKTF